MLVWAKKPERDQSDTTKPKGRKSRRTSLKVALELEGRAADKEEGISQARERQKEPGRVREQVNVHECRVGLWICVQHRKRDSRSGRGQREGGLEGESAKKISEGLLRATLSRLSPPGPNPRSLQPDQLRLQPCPLASD